MTQIITRGYKALLAEANARVPALAPLEAAQRLGSGEAVLVDVRDVRELEREGRIPGAFHCPRGMLEFWIDPESPYFKPVFGEDRAFIFLCAAGWRSVLSAATALDMGLKPVLHVEGGFKAWKESGAPVSP
ncbi:rhodanese-like domain-containing protein [Xanthobacter sp. V4C-4]|uniref:rhodanese-like domain-containing protein n=1 Tax=Xanthobacter cornucopiae TaxID=3119924 RepID=UPI00372AE498